MSRRTSLNLILLLFVLVFGWSARSTEAMVHFEKKELSIEGKKIVVEIADNQEKAARGLMFRQKLEPGTGMLFVFPDARVRSFWMKNTFIPLSIGYFDSKNVLIDIQDMEPVSSEMQTNLPNYVSKGPAQYALEVPKGWFSQHKIGLGARFKFK